MNNLKSAEEAKKAILERIAAKLSEVSENAVWGLRQKHGSSYGHRSSGGCGKRAHSSSATHANRH